MNTGKKINLKLKQLLKMKQKFLRLLLQEKMRKNQKYLNSLFLRNSYLEFYINIGGNFSINMKMINSLQIYLMNN